VLHVALKQFGGHKAYVIKSTDVGVHERLQGATCHQLSLICPEKAQHKNYQMHGSHDPYETLFLLKNKKNEKYYKLIMHKFNREILNSC